VREGLPPGFQDWLGLRARTLMLALDYDGTLVPIYRRPEQACPDPELLNLLGELSQEATVVILTGRDQRNMERWIPAPAITIVASHGAEWRYNGRWEPLLFTQKNQNPLKTLTERLEEVFRETPGVIIESKGASVAFHYRLVNRHSQPDILNRFEELVGRWMEDNEAFELLEGKCVKEIRPLGLNKGRALHRVVEMLGLSDAPVLAMGDDRTDEDMFRSLGDQDVSILVGAGDTRAAVCLRDVWEARELLKEILRIRKKSGVRSQKSE